MSNRGLGWVLCAATVTFLTIPTLGADDRKGYVIQCGAGQCAKVAAAVRASGGEVTHQYRNVDAIAATLDQARVAALLQSLPGIVFHKDVQVGRPEPVRGAQLGPLQPEGVLTVTAEQAASLASARPANYVFNNLLTGAATLHALGIQGQGVIVANIDSGTANNPAVVPALAGTVIGGESLVPLAEDPVASATSTLNDPHGTFTGSMIAAHVFFLFPNASTVVQSLQLHSPESVIPCASTGPPPICPATLSIVPMLGSAPSARIYALKVFSSLGGGAPESRVLQAMDRAITLRRNFNNGMPSVPVNPGCGAESNPCIFDSLPIQVVNMSLSGPTLAAGRDLNDQITVAMLAVGITPVASAANNGFAAMTGGSPGTGIGSLTVGAANTAVHERVLRDAQYGLGIGALYRASDHTQTAYFSSRGPTADGRIDPDVVANGFASFAQAANGGIFFVSGTSFSSPTTAGVAALLRQGDPTASATELRNALIESANPNLLGDMSGPIDQGAGFIDAPAALARLQAGMASPIIRVRKPKKEVDSNLKQVGLEVVKLKGDMFSTHVSDLRPGQVANFFVETRDDTDALVVRLQNITPALPPAQQNAFFGDDVFFQIADAPTSLSLLRAEEFVVRDATFDVPDPQTGLVRVALQGDWTNAGNVSADLIVERVKSKLPAKTGTGKVQQADLIPVAFEVPAGTAELVVELFWDQDWSRYPTNDVDLILLDPSFSLNFDGATLNSPERVVLTSPAPGIWTAFVNGFQINDKEDRFTLRATADGVRLKELK